MFDLSAWHILALEKTMLFSAEKIKKIALSIPYNEIFSITDLRYFLSEQSTHEFFPEERCWNEAKIIIDNSSKIGIYSISIASDLYPNSLRIIDNPPNMLYLRGNLECLNKLPGVSVVGSRKITANGMVIAERISSYLASKGWVIVSGLALGVDTLAHKGALSTGVKSSTVAVLAHGLEKAKPASNQKLADAILNNGGLWVSEYHIGIPAKPFQFVARNRIQLGLSVGSVIVEADIKSGSVTQAKFCQKQRRPLFAIVPEDESNKLNLLCEGTKMMVRELDAFPIKSKHDYPIMLERLRQQYEILQPQQRDLLNN